MVPGSVGRESEAFPTERQRSRDTLRSASGAAIPSTIPTSSTVYDLVHGIRGKRGNGKRVRLQVANQFQVT
jgi:hypothetical protein